LTGFKYVENSFFDRYGFLYVFIKIDYKLINYILKKYINSFIGEHKRFKYLLNE